MLRLRYLSSSTLRHILPPCTPAPGPISITWSDKSIVSWSCSTTITVFPRSLNFFRVLRSFSLSLWWRPIDGSSRIYVTPTNPPQSDLPVLFFVLRHHLNFLHFCLKLNNLIPHQSKIPISHLPL